MAKVLGESGRYVSEVVITKRLTVVAICLAGVGSTCLLWGLSLGFWLHSFELPGWASGVISLVSMLIILGFAKWGFPKVKQLEQEEVNFRKGATGEASVGNRLERFPEQFRVINDLTTPYGNLDHVVVGPTGVYVLDTKNWRGVVSPDGNGELLCNGKPLDKPYVRLFISRVMGIKDRVKALAAGLDPYFQAVFVFTSARVEANWGTTRSVHCIRDEQLYDYIVESKRGRKLAAAEVEKIAQAFLGLAHMDADFTAKAGKATLVRDDATETRTDALQQVGNYTWRSGLKTTLPKPANRNVRPARQV